MVVVYGDVEAENGETYSATSVPTQTEVTALIALAVIKIGILTNQAGDTGDTFDEMVLAESLRRLYAQDENWEAANHYRDERDKMVAAYGKTDSQPARKYKWAVSTR